MLGRWRARAEAPMPGRWRGRVAQYDRMIRMIRMTWRAGVAPLPGRNVARLVSKPPRCSGRI